MFDLMKKSILSAVLVSTLALGQAPNKPQLQKASDVPDPEKVDRSASTVTSMRGTLKDVLGKLEEARKTKDVVKLNCVNEKLTQIKGLLRISEQSDVALQEAVSKRDSSSAEHEYTKVMLAGQKVEQMRLEAEECIGNLAFRHEENLSSEVEEPKDLPKGDPTKHETKTNVTIPGSVPGSPTL